MFINNMPSYQEYILIYLKTKTKKTNNQTATANMCLGPTYGGIWNDFLNERYISFLGVSTDPWSIEDPGWTLSNLYLLYHWEKH